jgi:3-hydroxybutyryl-CoA dehydrogenase
VADGTAADGVMPGAWREDHAVGVIGAGAMGAGIALVAARAGHTVHLADAAAGAVAKARSGHASALAREVEKQRLTRADADAVLARLHYHGGVDDLTPLAGCALVLEAIVERLEPKQQLFASLQPLLAPEAVLASNTSSLSIAAIGAQCRQPERVVGLHFFNPAPVMPLVEVIPGLDPLPASDPAHPQQLAALMRAWGKVPVLASDTPGFIVNRVARPFYGEAIRLLEEGVADCATIDWALRHLGGFKMGPFELMDFIGHDVNFAVTSAVYAGMFQDPRYKPSLTQQRLVQAGRLGRKSGRGFYDHTPGAAAPAPREDQALGEAIGQRVLAMLINEACDAVHYGVATPADVELAMTKGVNYPRGLLAWGDAIGPAQVLATLDALADEYREDRYRASVYLRRAVAQGRSLLP